MEHHAKELLGHGNPLGHKTRWQVIVIEGVLLIGLGLYILLDKEGAGSAILQVISLVLLIASILGIATEFRVGSSDMVLFSALRAGIGLTVGAIGSARWLWEYIDDRPLRLILGWGLLAYAAIHIVGLLTVRRGTGINWGSLGISLLTIALGVVLLVNDDANTNATLNLLSALFIVFGLLLSGIGYLRYRSLREPSTAIG